MTFEESMRKAGEEILNLIGVVSSSKFATGDGLPINDIVTSRTGDLMNSILGGRDSIRDIVITGDTAIFTIGSKRPYAALMELGGVRPVTESMRKFFKFKFFSSGAGDPKKKMWSALRFKNVIRYLPRPYLTNTAEELMDEEIPAIIGKYTTEFVKTTFEQIIKGTPRADVYNAPYQGLKPI